MKEIINNPKKLVYITIALILVYEIPYQFKEIKSIFQYNFDLVNDLKYILIWSRIIPLLYFILLISKFKVKLSVTNFILVLYYIINSKRVYDIYFYFADTTSKSVSDLLRFSMITSLPSFIAITIFLIIIFYSKKNKKNLNLMSGICLTICLLHFFYTMKVFAPNIDIGLKYSDDLYLIPMILYFRLYAINKFKERKI